jgi:hypothetical protein
MTFQRELFRMPTALPVTAMQTHVIAAPLATHWRTATCEEVQCAAYLNGWKLALTGLDEGDIWQARNCGRRYVEVPDDGGPVLVFEPGQPCFKTSKHRIRTDRPELFVVRGGDHRGNPLKIPDQRFSGPDAWQDHMATHLEKIQNRR